MDVPLKRLLLLLVPVVIVAGGSRLILQDAPLSDVLSPTTPSRPNVIFISVDTLRPDHLSAYGYSRPTSPRLDALASQGVRFSNAYAQASWTLPSHMGMMTSQYPHVHGVQQETDGLPKAATTLAEVLSVEGYQTAAFVSWVFLGRKYGFDQGFDEYTELLPDDLNASTSIEAEQVTMQAVDWLNKHHPAPFFLFVHYFDPHINYEAPPPYDKMFDPDYKGPADGSLNWLRKYIKGLHETPNKIDPRDLDHIKALYDAEIRYTDAQLGRLFDTLEKTVGMENCLIVFTSDHGEEMNEHGSMEGHQWTLYDETIHIPLMFTWQGSIAAGQTIDRLVESIDLPATILGLLSIPSPGGFQGRNLAGILRGDEPEIQQQFAFGEIRRFNRKQYVRTDQYKLIHTDDIGRNKRGIPVVAGYEMFDLLNDPREQRNIFSSDSEVAIELVRALNDYKEGGVSFRSSEEPAEVILSEKQRQRLRSLGYVE